MGRSALLSLMLALLCACTSGTVVGPAGPVPLTPKMLAVVVEDHLGAGFAAYAPPTHTAGEVATSVYYAAEPGHEAWTVTASLGPGAVSYTHLDVYKRQVGNCTGPVDLTGASISSLTSQPCAQAHYYEVHARIPLTGDVYPGAEVLGEQAKTQCSPSFVEYVGVEPQYSRYTSAYLVPDEAAWAVAENRVITCLAGSAEGGLLGSAKGDVMVFPDKGECTGKQDVAALEVAILDCSSAHNYEAVSYTHLDVYKRQLRTGADRGALPQRSGGSLRPPGRGAHPGERCAHHHLGGPEPVSYTHLAARDVDSVRVACLLTLAASELPTSGLPGALPLLEEARRIAGDDAELLARWRCQRGMVLGRSGAVSYTHLDVYKRQTYRSGSAIVSTMPRSQVAAVQASVVAGPGAPDTRNRATIDRDDFSGGFGVWSGTSFAAPVLAGELAQALVDQDPVDVSREAMLARGWEAIHRVLKARKPDRS